MVISMPIFGLLAEDLHCTTVLVQGGGTLCYAMPVYPWLLTILLLPLILNARVDGVKLNRVKGLKPRAHIGAKSAALVTLLLSGNAPFELSHEVASCPCVDCTAGLRPAVARAANLPSNNGASGKIQGTEASLQAIRRMGKAAQRAKEMDNDVVAVRELLTNEFPSTEKAFKRTFDEFSQGVSYKQQFLDKNAFLVYYTQGYDGPGRQNIETETSAEQLQKNQYGFRNDAWIALDDSRAEADYLLEIPNAKGRGSKELTDSLTKLGAAIDSYISLGGLK